MRRFLTQCLLSAAFVVPLAAHPQQFPVKSVRLMVAFPPGGGADITARPIAEKLSEKWGRSVIVDNRGGASGMIGAQLVANSPADGYTLLLSSSSEVALNVSLFAKMPYDPVKAFEPMTVAATTPMVLVTHPSLAPKTAKEFVAFVAARPNQLNYASGGVGTPQHFAGELFKLRAKLVMTHVPYKSGGLQVVDLVGGQVPCGFAALLPAMPHVKSGRLRALSVTSLDRSQSLPDIPSMSESGYSGFNISQWYAAWAPAGTPREIVDKITADIIEIVKSADFRRRMQDQGADPVGSSAAETARFQLSEIKKYVEIAQRANIKAD